MPSRKQQKTFEKRRDVHLEFADMQIFSKLCIQKKTKFLSVVSQEAIGKS